MARDRRWPWLALIVVLSVGLGVLGAQWFAGGMPAGVGPAVGGLVDAVPFAGSGDSAPSGPNVHVGVANSANSSSSSSATGGSITRSGRPHPVAPPCTGTRRGCASTGGSTTSTLPTHDPVHPHIRLTLRCDLINVNVCRGRGYTVPYDSLVVDAANRPIYDRCFDHASVTDADGKEIWHDSFACNSANPIRIMNDEVLPDGDYTIKEQVEMQDGGSATETLTFTVHS